jgi:hypothetical protein
LGSFAHLFFQLAPGLFQRDQAGGFFRQAMGLFLGHLTSLRQGGAALALLLVAEATLGELGWRFGELCRVGVTLARLLGEGAFQGQLDLPGCAGRERMRQLQLIQVTLVNFIHRRGIEQRSPA